MARSRKQADRDRSRGGHRRLNTIDTKRSEYGKRAAKAAIVEAAGTLRDDQVICPECKRIVGLRQDGSMKAHNTSPKRHYGIPCVGATAAVTDRIHERHDLIEADEGIYCSCKEGPFRTPQGLASHVSRKH